MDFDIPAEIAAYLRELDAFIEREIRPLERENDNIRFFDHRREHARTDWTMTASRVTNGKSCWPR